MHSCTNPFFIFCPVFPVQQSIQDYCKALLAGFIMYSIHYKWFRMQQHDSSSSRLLSAVKLSLIFFAMTFFLAFILEARPSQWRHGRTEFLRNSFQPFKPLLFLHLVTGGACVIWWLVGLEVWFLLWVKRSWVRGHLQLWRWSIFTPCLHFHYFADF